MKDIIKKVFSWFSVRLKCFHKFLNDWIGSDDFCLLVLFVICVNCCFVYYLININPHFFYNLNKDHCFLMMFILWIIAVCSGMIK
jgi:hypothetical protein